MNHSPLEIAKSIVQGHFERPSVACYSIGEAGEGYSAKLQEGVVAIDAESAAAAAFGAAQVVAGAKSGHLRESIGSNKPLVPLRPLWLGAENELFIAPGISLGLPALFLEEPPYSLSAFCQRLYELGFNGIILGSRGKPSSASSELPFGRLRSLCRELRAFGLKLFTSPRFHFPEGVSLSPLDEEYCRGVKRALGAVAELLEETDGLLWQSAFLDPSFHCHPAAVDASQQELALAEARLIEKEINVPLLYLLPGSAAVERQAPWLLQFIEELGPSTLFSFFSTAGEPGELHKPPHPLWELLRHYPEPLERRLLPLVNFGSVGCGEGVWPSIPFDLIEETAAHCTRRCFAGVAGLVNTLPCSGSLTDASLWVAGNSLWGRRSAALLAESWCRAYRPGIKDPRAFVRLAGSSRALALALSALAGGEFSFFATTDKGAIVEAIASDTAALERAFAVFEESKVPPQIKDYGHYFIKEARKHLIRFTQREGLSPNKLVAADDRAPLMGSTLEAIHSENSFFWKR